MRIFFSIVGIVVIVLLSCTLTHGRHTKRSVDGEASETYYYSNAAVAADNANCSIVGKNIMEFHNGNAIDAAIATCLCQGVLQQFASGLGGGGVAVIYIKELDLYETWDFREWAPGAAHKDMYEENPLESSVGGKAAGVPGEIAGLWKLHQQYGRAAWADIVEPSIQYAESSIVSPLLGSRIEEYAEAILLSPSLSSVFAPNGVLLKEGDELKQPALAETLRSIRDDGPLSFYGLISPADGGMNIAQKIVSDLAATTPAGIITEDDFHLYYSSGVFLRECTEVFYLGQKIVGAPPPFSGGLCHALAFNLIEYYNFPLMGNNSDLAQHYLIEAWKWAFSDRMALGDPSFVDLQDIWPYFISKEHAATLRKQFSSTTTYLPPHYVDLVPLEQIILDGGTSHMSAVDAEGNAVALTSTVNLGFGSKFLSMSTGIILNNEMDDFSSPGLPNQWGIPPSEANFIAPYKKPLSSMSPTITFVNGEVSLVIGGSGGTTIITAVMQSMLNSMWGRPLGEAIAQARCHNQNTGNTKIEVDYSESFQEFLISTHHNLELSTPIASVQGILKYPNGTIAAACDWRKMGKPAGY